MKKEHFGWLIYSKKFLKTENSRFDPGKFESRDLMTEEEAKKKIGLEVAKWKKAFVGGFVEKSLIESLEVDEEDGLFARAEVLDSDAWNSRIGLELKLKFKRA